MPKQLFKLATILTFILLSTSLHAQIDSEKTDHGVNINFFNGYAISYKWNTSQDLNYRIYLGLNSSWTDSDSDSERERSYNNATDNNKYYYKGDGNNNSIYFNSNLSFQFMFGLISKESYSFYLGVGPRINYSYGKSNNNNNTTQNDSQRNSTNSNESSNINHSFGIGVISLVGIEAFITKNISLFAESHIIAKRSWTTSNNSDSDYYSGNTSKNYSKSSGTVASWNANLQLVKVGLGIYF